MQLSLLDQLPEGPDPHFENAARRDLGRGAWVEFIPGWVKGQRQIGEKLLRTANWESHRRNMYDRIVEVPRLMAGPPGTFLQFGDGEVERRPSGASLEEIDQSASDLAYLASLLSRRYGRVLDSVTLAYYRNGRDSVAFHGDKLGALRSDTVVAIVSLGAPRTFVLRPAQGAERQKRTPSMARDTLTFRFGGGDLLVMGGTCQETFEHAVPKMAHVGPRIAVMFRESLTRSRLAGPSRLAGAGVTPVRPPVASENFALKNIASASRTG